jgi:hypothetical protein
MYKNKSKEKFKIKQKELARKLYINSIKAKGCQLCGYNKCLTAIEFHHIGNDKLFEMSDSNHKSLDNIKIEISKCIVVCANCHRELHEHTVGNATKEGDMDKEQLELW